MPTLPPEVDAAIAAGEPKTGFQTKKEQMVMIGYVFLWMLGAYPDISRFGERTLHAFLHVAGKKILYLSAGTVATGHFWSTKFGPQARRREHCAQPDLWGLTWSDYPALLRLIFWDGFNVLICLLQCTMFFRFSPKGHCEPVAICRQAFSNGLDDCTGKEFVQLLFRTVFEAFGGDDEMLIVVSTAHKERMTEF